MRRKGVRRQRHHTYTHTGSTSKGCGGCTSSDVLHCLVEEGLRLVGVLPVQLLCLGKVGGLHAHADALDAHRLVVLELLWVGSSNLGGRLNATKGKGQRERKGMRRGDLPLPVSLSLWSLSLFFIMSDSRDLCRCV